MKARTREILKAAENPLLLAHMYGVCEAIYKFEDSFWFYMMFRPSVCGYSYWIGPLDAKHLELRFMFIAMAAAVSETEP